MSSSAQQRLRDLDLDTALKSSLVRLCRDLGLPNSGLKSQLVARLSAHRATLPPFLPTSSNATSTASGAPPTVTSAGTTSTLVPPPLPPLTSHAPLPPFAGPGAPLPPQTGLGAPLPPFTGLGAPLPPQTGLGAPLPPFAGLGASLPLQTGLGAPLPPFAGLGASLPPRKSALEPRPPCRLASEPRSPHMPASEPSPLASHWLRKQPQPPTAACLTSTPSPRQLHSKQSPKRCWLTAQPHLPPPPSPPLPQPPGSTSHRQPRHRPSLPCRALWQRKPQRPAYQDPPPPSSLPSAAPSPASRPNSQQQLQLVSSLTSMNCCMLLMLRVGRSLLLWYRWGRVNTCPFPGATKGGWLAPLESGPGVLLCMPALSVHTSPSGAPTCWPIFTSWRQPSRNLTCRPAWHTMSPSGARRAGFTCPPGAS